MTAACIITPSTLELPVLKLLLLCIVEVFLLEEKSIIILYVLHVPKL